MGFGHSSGKPGDGLSYKPIHKPGVPNSNKGRQPKGTEPKSSKGEGFGNKKKLPFDGDSIDV